MSEVLHIIKNNIRNVVDANQFENIYKPKGWVIDENFEEQPVDENLKILKSEQEILNYTNSKKRKYIFDDKLFKE